MTWMQTRTSREMLGRIMALLMFSSTGLSPISQAIPGVLSKWNLTKETSPPDTGKGGSQFSVTRPGSLMFHIAS
jgi:hypothetical protein